MIVVFRFEGKAGVIEEEVEVPKEASEAEIEEVFNNWLRDVSKASWWIK